VNKIISRLLVLVSNYVYHAPDLDSGGRKNAGKGEVSGKSDPQIFSIIDFEGRGEQLRNV